MAPFTFSSQPLCTVGCRHFYTLAPAMLSESCCHASHLISLGCLPCVAPHACVLSILQNQPRIHLGFQIVCDHQISSVLKESFLPYRIHNYILPYTFLIFFFSLSVSTPQRDNLPQVQDKDLLVLVSQSSLALFLHRGVQYTTIGGFIVKISESFNLVWQLA